MVKKKNVLIILAVAALMVFGVSAASVYATDSFLNVNGNKIDPNTSVTHTGQGWEYYGDKKTLYLDGLGSSDEPVSVEFAGFDLTVDLANKNYVSGIDGYLGTLTITGTGSLFCGDVHGITAQNVRIKGGTVNVDNSEYRGIAGDIVEISGKANVIVNSYWEGIYAGEVNISGGSLNVTADDVAIQTGSGEESEASADDNDEYSDSVNITGGTVTLNSFGYVGIGSKKVDISGGNVTVNSDGDRGIYARESVSISGKDTRVDVTGGKYEEGFESEGTSAAGGTSTQEEYVYPAIVSPKISISSPLAIITPEGGKVGKMDKKIRPEGTTAQEYIYQTIVDKDGNPAQHAVIYARDYKVTVQKPQNGTLTANKTIAKATEQVKLTAKPASGYTLDKLTYTDSAGKVTNIGSSGQFTMPASDVTVKATFKKKQAAQPSGVLLVKMTSKGKDGFTLRWSKMGNVKGYDIFFAPCDGKGKPSVYRNVKTISDNKTFAWTKTGLEEKRAYKAYVKAYVKKNGKKTYVKTSPMVHAYTSGSTKYHTNAKSVTVNKTAVTLQKGKTFKIKAKVRKLNAKKWLMPKKHVPKLRYISSNSKIASVSGGTITAKGQGTCYVYVYAHNGVSKKIKVTVK